MADDGQVIRGINWRQTFPFTNIFRSFRIAIHLSKLVLGLALFFTIFFGGTILDAIWPIHARAVIGEMDTYQAMTLNGATAAQFPAWRDQQQKDADDAYAGLLRDSGVDKDDSDAAHTALLDDAHNRRKLSDIESAIIKQRDDRLTATDKAYTDAKNQINSAAAPAPAAANPPGGGAAANPLAAPTPADKQKALDDAKKNYDDQRAQIYDDAREQYNKAGALMGAGIFDEFYHYEVKQVTSVARAAVSDQWLSPDGVLDCVYRFFAVGPIWLIWQHMVFAIIFGIIFLFAWSLFGGAIARIAAVHVARDEKISVRQAMNFSAGKLLSYVSAPVIPLLIVMIIGLIITLVAIILGNIPFLGPILIGILFILALLAGFVITLVLLGTAGGFNLMYPTIAIEGSDSFDAISRSFSYVYARPWRMLFYTAVAILYGGITYLFVHMFIWMMLAITHHFVELGIFGQAANGRQLLQTMWPSPNNAGRLTYAIDKLALDKGAYTGAILIKCWVMLLVSFLAAFAISLYFSVNTVIYFLMRSEVDATEMDDVYVEQADDELEPMPAATTVSVTTVTTTAPATEVPPASDGSAGSQPT